LTILGFGYGNLKDNRLENLTKDAYDGNYYYIDTILEARRVLVDKIGGTLVTVARGVKASVEFNPAAVDKYRLLGYENKLITQDQWDDPNTVAGDIGAGHTVTAIFEVVLKDGAAADEYATASIKFKDPDNKTDDSEYTVSAAIDAVTSPNNDEMFIACVVEAALVMRGSQYKGTASLSKVISRLDGIKTYLDNDPYKSEFLTLMKTLNG